MGLLPHQYTSVSVVCRLSAVERSSLPVNYDDVSEQSVYVVTPLVAVLAVVNAFVMALLVVAFITDSGNALRSQRVSLIVIPFCLSVWMSVGHSATYSLPRLIDRNQIWSAGIYLSSDPCKPFWIPYLPYFRCQREKYAKLRLFPTRILATANVTHRAI